MHVREMVPLVYDEASLGSPNLIKEDDGEDMYVPVALFSVRTPITLSEEEFDQLPVYRNVVPPVRVEAARRRPDLREGGEGEDMHIPITEMPRALAELELDQLPSYKFNVDSHLTHQTSCVVCMCGFEAEQMIRVLPCSHHFHAECVDTWLQVRASCPVCRDNIANYYIIT